MVINLKIKFTFANTQILISIPDVFASLYNVPGDSMTKDRTTIIDTVAYQ